jgi:hypothetical protein
VAADDGWVLRKAQFYRGAVQEEDERDGARRLLIALAVALHVGAVLQRGGLPLARSMASLKIRSSDRPGDWPAQIWASLRRGLRS